MLRLLVQVLVVAVVLCAADAAGARDLYTGESSLEETSSGPSDPLARALDEVLARLTGMTEQSLVERLDLARADLQLLVLSQQRVRRERLAPDGVSTVEQLRLRVDFDPAGVDALLAGENLPRLGRTRPAILLWLAIEDEYGVRLEGGAALDETVAIQARRLGLEILRPLGDLQDLSEIEAIDIRGGFLDAAEPGALRYGAGMIAMLDLRQDGTEWIGRWFWRLEGRDAGLQSRADSSEAIVAQGLEAVLGALVDRFGRIAGADEGGILRLVVEGVEDEIQYSEVLRHLGSLGQVDDVQVVIASGQTIDFDLNLSSAGLEDALMIGGVLDVVERSRDGSLRVRLKR